MFRTKHLHLTKDQKERGVIYSSELVNYSIDTERIVHEVIPSEQDNWRERLENLRDVSFFRHMANDMGWDVVNIVRS